MAFPVYPIYPSDLSDDEWALLSSLIPAAKPGGRPRSVEMRRIVNGLFYVLRSGCAWVSGRYLPRDVWALAHRLLLPASLAFRWHRNIWEQIHTHWRELARQRAGRDPTPSAAIIGRKRHLLVDTEGLLLKVVVHPANLHDQLGAKLVLGALGTAFPRLRHIWADQGYAGALRTWTREPTGIGLEVVYPWWRQIKRYFPDLLEPLGVEKGSHVLPCRWVVERSIAWLGRSRRLSMDYERRLATSEALIYLAGIRLLLARLTLP